jgi:hypothetical protein
LFNVAIEYPDGEEQYELHDITAMAILFYEIITLKTGIDHKRQRYNDKVKHSNRVREDIMKAYDDYELASIVVDLFEMKKRVGDECDPSSVLTTLHRIQKLSTYVLEVTVTQSDHDLHFAIATNDRDKVNIMLQENTDIDQSASITISVNSVESRMVNASPLCVAVTCMRVSTAIMLLEKGANPNWVLSVNDMNISILSLAIVTSTCDARMKGVVSALIKNGAKCDTITTDASISLNTTPFLQAIWYGFIPEALTMLEQEGSASLLSVTTSSLNEDQPPTLLHPLHVTALSYPLEVNIVPLIKKLSKLVTNVSSFSPLVTSTNK